MIELSKEHVLELQKEAEASYIAYLTTKDAYDKASEEYLKKSRRFKEADYQLALVDGRLKKIPSVGEKKEKKQPEITIEQLTEIAEKLGIQVSSLEVT